MSELKTLKDMKYILGIDADKDNQHLSGTFISQSELRQEAIKYIKFIKCSCKFSQAEGCAYCEGQIDYIKLFFNITEDELK